MASPASASAKPPILCDVCRKCVEIPTPCVSLDDASAHQSIREHPLTLKRNGHAGHFDCSICLDVCCDPVVTLCGHLFCWPCLYCWLSLHSVSNECPVCKANVQGKIVPVYGHSGAEQSKHSAAMMFPDIGIPCRPLHSSSDALESTNAITNRDIGEHNEAVQDDEMHSMRGIRHAALSANEGLFGSMLRCGMTLLLPHRGGFVRERVRNRTSIRMSCRNEKELILHGAFIGVAAIAIVGLIVC